MDKYTNDLLQAARQGNVEAFEHIYHMYKDKIYALTLSTLREPQDAEDATQQTFIKVYENLGSLNDLGAFNTWIQRIAINESNMLLRKRRGNISIDDESTGALVEKIEDDFMLPQDYAEQSDLSQRLREIINELPAVQRQALVLQIYSELSISEIARIMDCSENTVKSRIRYAKAHIKTEIEERERKSGDKFFGVVMLPFGSVFFRFTQNQSMSHAASARVWGEISSHIGQIAASGAVSGAAAGAAAKGGMALGAKLAIASLVSVAVICGSVITTAVIMKNNRDASADSPSATADETQLVTEAPTEAPTQADEAPRYQSYLDLLKGSVTDIKNYGLCISENDPDVVSFADFDGDGKEEMIYLTAPNVTSYAGGVTGSGSMDIVTYDENSDTVTNLYNDTQWFMNAGGAGGARSVLYVTNDGIYQCQTAVGEIESFANKYKLTFDGNSFTREQIGQRLTGADMASAASGAKWVIISSTQNSSVGVPGSANDLGMTYDEAIAYLQGKLPSSGSGETKATEEEMLAKMAGKYSASYVSAGGSDLTTLSISADGNINVSIQGRFNPRVTNYSGKAGDLTDKRNGIYSLTVTNGDTNLNGDTLTYFPAGTPLSLLTEKDIKDINMLDGGDPTGSLDTAYIISDDGGAFRLSE